MACLSALVWAGQSVAVHKAGHGWHTDAQQDGQNGDSDHHFDQGKTRLARKLTRKFFGYLFHVATLVD